MLSKPDSNIINVNLDTPIQVTTISITSSRYDNKTWVSWTATKSGTYHLGGSIYTSHDYDTLHVYKNGQDTSDEVTRQNFSTKYQTFNIDITFSCLEWDIINFWLEANNQNLGDSVTDAPLSLTVLGMAKVGSIKILPREIKSLGNLLTGTIYGIHTDNIYHGGIMMEKTTIASTGAITLGNAVGYIKVNFNGEIIKIPYYS